MKREIVSTLVVVLFFGLALAPSINADNKMSLDPVPDLDCWGEVDWVDIKPGSTKTAEIFVENIGEPNSSLDWEITKYPFEWGEWTFDPWWGNNLKPEDGDFQIDVSVIVPLEQNSVFDGEIIITNKNDSNDYCSIQVTLTTKNQDTDAFNFDSYTPIQLVFLLINKLRYYEGIESEEDVLQIIESDAELSGIVEELKSYSCGCEDDYKPDLGDRRWWIVCLFLAPIWIFSVMITLGTGVDNLETIVFAISDIFNCGFE